MIKANKISLIAEIGWNFCGDMDVAAKMIEAAAGAGADYAKFQTWKVSRLKPGPWDTDGRRQIYENAELSEEDHHYLKKCCDDNGIRFLTSCFSARDLDFIRTLTDEVKIPSPECSNHDLVKGAINRFEKVYISTGAAPAYEWTFWSEYENVVIMHCVSSYPCLPENFNASKLRTIIHEHGKRKSKRVGFSGHYPMIWDAITAIAAGCSIIEKHFTIDHYLPGRDNKFAILPHEFTQIREFADVFPVMWQSNHNIGTILECEAEYRQHHKSRWDGP